MAHPEDRTQPTVIKRLEPLPPDSDGDLEAPPRLRAGWVRWAVLAGVAVVVGLWLIGTPPGIDGKARAVGFAICHQIVARTFVAGDVVMPLCARCTGTFLAVIVGFVGPVLLGRGRAGRLPPRSVLAVMLLFTAAWAVDGANSYLHLFPGFTGIYEPSNTLRLLTGSLQGLTMAGLVYPVFNQSVWRRWRPQRSLRHLGDLAVLVGAVLLVDVLVLTHEPLVLTVLGWLSATGVLLIMTAIQTVVVVMLSRQLNRIDSWRDLALPAIAGFGLTIMLIGIIDAARFAWTGSWAGFTIPAP